MVVCCTGLFCLPHRTPLPARCLQCHLHLLPACHLPPPAGYRLYLSAFCLLPSALPPPLLWYFAPLFYTACLPCPFTCLYLHLILPAATASYYILPCPPHIPSFLLSAFPTPLLPFSSGGRYSVPRRTNRTVAGCLGGKAGLVRTGLPSPSFSLYSATLPKQAWHCALPACLLYLFFCLLCMLSRCRTTQREGRRGRGTA